MWRRQGLWERKERGEKQKSREKRKTEYAVADSYQPRAEPAWRSRLRGQTVWTALPQRCGVGVDSVAQGITCGRGPLTLGDLGKALLPSARCPPRCAAGAREFSGGLKKPSSQVPCQTNCVNISRVGSEVGLL